MSANLDLSLPTAATNHTDQHIDMVGKVDSKLTEELAVSFDSGDSQAITISSADAKLYTSYVVVDTVSYTGSTPHTNTLTFPAVSCGKFQVRNNCGRLLDVQVSGQTDAPVVELEGHASAELYNDGSDIRRVNNLLSASFFFPGAVAVGNRVASFLAPHRCWLRKADNGTTDAGNSVMAHLVTGPSSGAVVVGIWKNAAPVGTLSIDNSGDMTSLDITSEVTLDRGDRVALIISSITAGSPADLSCTLVLEH